MTSTLLEGSMPFSTYRTEREFADSMARRVADWVVESLYRFGVVGLALAALSVAVHGFTQSYAEGTRSLIFFLIPSLWGAYALAVFDGQPDAFNRMMPQLAYGISVLAAVVIIAVLSMDAPTSLVNLALGSMEAFFFVMRTSSQPSPHQRMLDANTRALAGALLILLTLLCSAMAVAV